ncbi:unnamed protein product, partial [marine sediment metagenome]
MGIHGKPDWGLQLKKTIYSFDDLSELAVRLGSIDFFDRRGDVILLDSFEYGLGKWDLGGGSVGSIPILSTDKVRSGGYSAKLVGEAIDTGYSSMSIDFPYPALSKWGFETSFLMYTNIDTIAICLKKFTGSQKLEGRVKYD